MRIDCLVGLIVFMVSEAESRTFKTYFLSLNQPQIHSSYHLKTFDESLSPQTNPSHKRSKSAKVAILTIVLHEQLSPGLAALAITYIMMIGDSTRLDYDDYDHDNDDNGDNDDDHDDDNDDNDDNDDDDDHDNNDDDDDNDDRDDNDDHDDPSASTSLVKA